MKRRVGVAPGRLRAAVKSFSYLQIHRVRQLTFTDTNPLLRKGSNTAHYLRERMRQ